MDIPRIFTVSESERIHNAYTREVRDAGPLVTHEARHAFSISAAARERCFVLG